LVILKQQETFNATHDPTTNFKAIKQNRNLNLISFK
jgi:hypothetical protein